MRSHLPESPSVLSHWNTDPNSPHSYFQKQMPTRREWIISILLFGVTLLTTSFAGLFYVAVDFGVITAWWAVLSKPSLLVQGFYFSFPLIAILLAHEMGHFFACRYYGVRCPPPFFIPVPVSIVGTFGAFIKIKSPFHHKRALFDIGIAGPLAGFLVTLPVLWVGLGLSELHPKGTFGAGELYFGEPFIFRYIAGLVLGYSPTQQDIFAHPIAMAGWFGLLVTSLNLLPIWQLDGGHITYALFGRLRQRRISIIALLALFLTSFVGWPTPSYLFFALVLLIIGARFHFYHPPTLRDEEELDSARIYMGFLAMIIFILCFTPVPISLA